MNSSYMWGPSWQGGAFLGFSFSLCPLTLSQSLSNFTKNSLLKNSSHEILLVEDLASVLLAAELIRVVVAEAWGGCGNFLKDSICLIY